MSGVFSGAVVAVVAFALGFTAIIMGHGLGGSWPLWCITSNGGWGACNQTQYKLKNNRQG